MTSRDRAVEALDDLVRAGGDPASVLEDLQAYFDERYEKTSRPEARSAEDGHTSEASEGPAGRPGEQESATVPHALKLAREVLSDGEAGLHWMWDAAHTLAREIIRLHEENADRERTLRKMRDLVPDDQPPGDGAGERWGVWVTGPEHPNGAWYTLNDEPYRYQSRDDAERLAARGLRMYPDYTHEVRPLPRPSPATTANRWDQCACDCHARGDGFHERHCAQCSAPSPAATGETDGRRWWIVVREDGHALGVFNSPEQASMWMPTRRVVEAVPASRAETAERKLAEAERLSGDLHASTIQLNNKLADAQVRVRELEAERDVLDARVNQLEETLRVIRAWDMLNPSGDVERFADAPWLRREIDAALRPSTPATEENENGY